MKTSTLIALLFSMLLFSCKKENTIDINYNTLTEERILNVSEQSIITDEDVASIERLITDNITDESLKNRFTEMLNSVKILKGVLPRMSQLRADPNINYSAYYEDIHAQVSAMSDLIPRKSALLKELEDNKDGYDNEEVIFSTEFAENMKQYWENEYKIKPIEGKSYIAYRRSDIAKIDEITYASYTDLMKFTDLKKISFPEHTALEGANGVYNLNKFTDLEELSINLKEGNKLLIDSCRQIKKLRIAGLDALERLDLTGRNEELSELRIGNIRSLRSIIIPDKKMLKDHNISIGSQSITNGLINLDTIIIEGSGVSDDEYSGFYASMFLGNPNMKLIRLSNMLNLNISGWRFVKTGVNPWGYDDGYNPTIKIENLDISGSPNLIGLVLDKINLSSPIDLTGFRSMTNLGVRNCALNAGADTEYMMSSKGLKGLETLTTLESLSLYGVSFDSDFSATLAKLENLWYLWLEEVKWPANTTLDLRNLKKLVFVHPHSAAGDWEGGYMGPYLSKLILWKGVQDNKRGSEPYMLLSMEDTGTEVTYVD